MFIITYTVDVSKARKLYSCIRQQLSKRQEPAESDPTALSWKQYSPESDWQTLAQADVLHPTKT